MKLKCEWCGADKRLKGNTKNVWIDLRRPFCNRVHEMNYYRRLTVALKLYSGSSLDKGNKSLNKLPSTNNCGKQRNDCKEAEIYESKTKS